MTKRRSVRKRKNGFSLPELIVVVGVILITVGMLAVYAMRDQPAKARNVERALEMNTVQEALDQYVAEGGTYPLPGVPTAPICIGTKTWAQLAPAGSVPTARQEHSAVWDTQGSRMIMFGGTTEPGEFQDLHSYTPSTNTWAPISTTGTPPSARHSHSAVWDPIGNRMFVFGGRNTNRLNDLYSFTPTPSNTWAPVSPLGTPPSLRMDSAAAWDSTGNRMLVFGGSQVGDVMSNELFSYTPSTNTWALVTTAGTAPSARAAASVVWDAQNSRFIIFGGNLGTGSYSNSVHYFNPATNVWSQPSISGTQPSVREDHVAVWDALGNRMLVFGGWNGSTFFQDLWSYSPSTSTWTQLPNNTTLPQARDETAGVWDGRQMILFGGDNGPGNLNDTFQAPGCYDLSPYLVPKYVSAIPEDPLSTSGQVDTGYTIQRAATTEKILTITAPLAELDVTISKSK